MKKLARESNPYVRVVNADGRFSSGVRYRDFELLVDAPSVPVTDPEADPPHAMAGDLLRQKSTDRHLTPFELYRDGVEIGNPEWWCVSYLLAGMFSERGGTPGPRRGLLKPMAFELKSGEEVTGWQFTRGCSKGLHNIEKDFLLAERSLHDKHHVYLWSLWRVGKEGAQPEGVSTRFALACLAQNSVEREPAYDQVRANVKGVRIAAACVEATVMDLRPGDVLLRAEEPPETRVRPVPLTLDHYEALRALVDEDENPLTELRPLAYYLNGGVLGFVKDRRKWGRRRKVWTPELWRVRFPVRSPVSEPIVAASDDGAIFELLCSVGGRMPVA